MSDRQHLKICQRTRDHGDGGYRVRVTLFVIAVITTNMRTRHRVDVLAHIRHQEIQRRDLKAASIPMAQCAGLEVRPKSGLRFCGHFFPVHFCSRLHLGMSRYS